MHPITAVSLSNPPRSLSLSRIEEDDERDMCGVSCSFHMKNVCLTECETVAPTHCTSRTSGSLHFYPTRVDISPWLHGDSLRLQVFSCISLLDCGFLLFGDTGKVTNHWRSEANKWQRLSHQRVCESVTDKSIIDKQIFSRVSPRHEKFLIL